MMGSTLGVYSFGLIFVSARTNKRHHHQLARRAKLKRCIPAVVHEPKGRIVEFLLAKFRLIHICRLSQPPLPRVTATKLKLSLERVDMTRNGF
jgi:hypothetical protein